MSVPNDHLPECPAGNLYADLIVCICDRLRAAEQRGVKEAMTRMLVWQENAPLGSRTYAGGYAEALADVRDRVMGLTTTEYTSHFWSAVMFHIDALATERQEGRSA